MTALVMELVEGEDLSQRIARLRAPGASARQAPEQAKGRTVIGGRMCGRSGASCSRC